MKVVAKRIGKYRAPQWKEIIKEIDRTLDKEVKPELRKRFEDVVENWEHKPKFIARKYRRGRDIAVIVYAAGPNKKIWNYVSGGTRPHIIRPKRAKALRFVWGGPGSYQAKTKPHPVSWGGPGTVSGGKEVYRQEVHHPGTEARNFEKAIGSLYQGRFVIRIQAAISRGILNAYRR